MMTAPVVVQNNLVRDIFMIAILLLFSISVGAVLILYFMQGNAQGIVSLITLLLGLVAAVLLYLGIKYGQNAG